MRFALGDVARLDAVAFVFMMIVFYLLNLLKTGDGVSGRRPDRWVQGEAHSLPGNSRGRCPLPKPSAEPTTTEAKRVVIVGYNRASPAVKPATLWLGFVSFFFPLD